MHISPSCVFRILGPCLLVAMVRGETEPASPQDQARFLAGMGGAGASLEQLSLHQAWREHARTLDTAWVALTKRQLEPIRSWARQTIPNVHADRQTLFYLFGGPDFLYAETLFPDAATYVICGIEPIGSLPDITRVSAENLESTLGSLRHSLRSILSQNYFITEDMRLDLEKGRLTGTLPILYLLLARAGCHIDQVSFLWIDESGKLVTNRTPTAGVKIDFTKMGHAPQTVFYFKTDLRDGETSRDGFLKWCEGLGRGNSLVKAATYLMHTGNFKTARSFLLSQSNTLIQDDSGIPVRYFDPALWELQMFGVYSKPTKSFERFFQPELAKMYREKRPKLPFAIGYRADPAQSTLMIATKH